MTDEIFNKEILKKKLFDSSDFLGFFYNVANELLTNSNFDYWNTQTYYQTDHRILDKVSFSSHYGAKLHLEITPVNIYTFNDELDGVVVTLHNEAQNWEIHKKILELCKLSNCYVSYSLPFVVQFETEKNKTTRILYKIVVPINESSHDIVLKMLNVIKLVENYAAEKGIEI